MFTEHLRFNTWLVTFHTKLLLKKEEFSSESTSKKFTGAQDCSNKEIEYCSWCVQDRS